MKHRLLFAAAATALMAAPTLASAQDSGVYIKGQAGYAVMSDTDIAPTNAGDNGLLGDVGAQGDFAAALGLGYDFGNNWRMELEGSQFWNDLGTIGGQPNSDADLRVSSLMLNVLYDFSDFGRWEPYVGAGVGIAEGDASFRATDFVNDTGAVLVRNPACVSGATSDFAARDCSVNDSDANFAWNLIAGLGYNITDNLTWDTNYRYLDAGSFDFDGTLVNAGVDFTPTTSDLNATLEDASAHVLMTGFRYRFGKATPPPPPVIQTPTVYTCWDGMTEVTDLALCPPQLYTCWDGATEVTDLALCPPQLVTCPDGSQASDMAACPPVVQAPVCDQFRQDIIYYEFDEAQSATTRNAINRVLDVGQFCQINSIRVVGHTDTSGAASYNMRLSERRANDAREELVRQGVDAASITSLGRGETEPAVQTGDGVREQQNRRTEVLVTLSELNGAMMNN